MEFRTIPQLGNWDQPALVVVKNPEEPRFCHAIFATPPAAWLAQPYVCNQKKPQITTKTGAYHCPGTQTTNNAFASMKT